MREEDDYGEVGGIPVLLEVEIERNGSVERDLEGLDFAEKADDRGVLQRVAGIFAGGNVGLEIFFGDGDPEFEGSARRKRGRVFLQRDGERFFVCWVGGGRSHA